MTVLERKEHGIDLRSSLEKTCILRLSKQWHEQLDNNGDLKPVTRTMLKGLVDKVVPQKSNKRDQEIKQLSQILSIDSATNLSDDKKETIEGFLDYLNEAFLLLNKIEKTLANERKSLEKAGFSESRINREISGKQAHKAKKQINKLLEFMVTTAKKSWGDTMPQIRKSLKTAGIKRNLDNLSSYIRTEKTKAK